MTSDQCNGLLDLFMLCKLASAAWLDIAPVNHGCDFKELSDVKEKVEELDELHVPDHKIAHVLSTNLPPAVFKRHFEQVKT